MRPFRDPLAGAAGGILFALLCLCGGTWLVPPAGAAMAGRSPRSDERIETIRQLLARHAEKLSPDTAKTQLANMVEKDFVSQTKCPPVPTASALSLEEIRKQTELRVAAATASHFPPLDERQLQQEAAKKYPIVEIGQNVSVTFQANPVRRTTVTGKFRGIQQGEFIVVGNQKILMKDLVPPPAVEVQRLQFDPDENKIKREEYMNQRMEASATARKAFAETEFNNQWTAEFNKTRELNETAGYIWYDNDWRGARQLIHYLLQESLAELKGIHASATQPVREPAAEPAPTGAPIAPSPNTVPVTDPAPAPVNTAPPAAPEPAAAPVPPPAKEPSAPVALPWAKKAPKPKGPQAATPAEAANQKTTALAAPAPAVPPGVPAAPVTGPTPASPVPPEAPGMTPAPPPATLSTTPAAPPQTVTRVEYRNRTSVMHLVLATLIGAALGGGILYYVKILYPMRGQGFFFNDRTEAEQEFWPLTEKSMPGFKYTSFKFTSFADASEAMCKISYIQRQGSGLQCTAPIYFGIYSYEQLFVAFVGGDMLTYPMWREAVYALSKGEGAQEFKSSAPPENVLTVQPALVDTAGKDVAFLQVAAGSGSNFAHLVVLTFKAPDRATATRFVGALKILTAGVQVLVETPEGVVRRDNKRIQNE